MFVLKKLLASLVLPLPFCLTLLLVGLGLLWFTQRQRAARWLITVGALLLLLLSYNAVGNLFLVPLEHGFHPLLVAGAAPDALDQQARQARFIVVLGGGHVVNPHLPPTSELNEITIARLVEAVRLKRQLPQAKLVLSGGFGKGVTHADLLAGAAVALGVPPEDLILEKRTFDTADEAHFITPIVGSAPFILVSSAAHLPRACALFRKAGATPLPSPADFVTMENPGVSVDSFFPSAGSLGKLERANHEYIGRFWSKLRGQL